MEKKDKLKFQFEGEVRELIPPQEHGGSYDDDISIFNERDDGYVTEEFFVSSLLRDLKGKKVRITIQEV